MDLKQAQKRTCLGYGYFFNNVIKITQSINKKSLYSTYKIQFLKIGEQSKKKEQTNKQTKIKK